MITIAVDPSFEQSLVNLTRTRIRAGVDPEQVGAEVGGLLDLADADLETRAGTVADAIITAISRGDGPAEACRITVGERIQKLAADEFKLADRINQLNDQLEASKGPNRL